MDPRLFVQPSIEEIKLHKNHYKQSVVSCFFETLDVLSSTWHNHTRCNKVGAVDFDLLNGDPRLSYPCLMAACDNKRSTSPKCNGKDKSPRLQRRCSLSDLDGRYSFRKKRTVAQKLIGVGDREMKAIISEVANELSVIYEYHLSVLYGLADVELLAENAVECMFQHLKQSDVQFTRNDMLKSVIESLPKSKTKKFVYLRTNDGKATLAWNVSKVYKQAGLRMLEDNRSVSELPRYKFFRCFSPYGQSCKPEIYGFRGPIFEWDEKRQIHKIGDQDMTTIQHSQHTQMAHTTQDFHQLYKPYHVICDLPDLVAYRNSLLDSHPESFNLFLQTTYSLSSPVMAVLRHRKSQAIRLDLFGANLSRTDLSKLAVNKFSFKLDNVQLRNSVLLNVDFSDLIITNVTFNGADLSFSNLNNVNFGKCNSSSFDGAKLKYVLTENTDLPVDLTASHGGNRMRFNVQDSGAVVKLIRQELVKSYETKVQAFCESYHVRRVSDLTKQQPFTLQRKPDPGEKGNHKMPQTLKLEEIFYLGKELGPKDRVTILVECNTENLRQHFIYRIISTWINSLSELSRGGSLNHAFEFDMSDAHSISVSEFSFIFSAELRKVTTSLAQSVYSDLCSNETSALREDPRYVHYVAHCMEQQDVLVVVNDHTDVTSQEKCRYVEQLLKSPTYIGCYILFLTKPEYSGPLRKNFDSVLTLFPS